MSTAEELLEVDRRAMQEYTVEGATVNPFPPHTGPGGRFGLELTFTNDEMIEISRGEVLSEWMGIFETTFAKWLAEIQRIAPRARLSAITKDLWDQSKVTVTLPLWCDELCSVPESPDQPHEEDVELFIHADDWVIEVGSSPLTIDQLSRHTHCFQRLLWDSAAAVGLFPHRRVGGGHLHLEFDSHFHGDATLLRNFIVDLCNRPLLFLGGLSLDLLNAPPLAILSPEQHQEFAKVIEEFDSLPADQRTIPALRHAIAKRVYTKSYVVANNFEMRYYVTHQDKYQAINILHQHTIEIRGLHPQRSAESLLALMRLFESRICQLKELQQPLAYAPQNLSSLVSMSVDRLMEIYKVDLPVDQVRQSLRDYVADAGIDAAAFPFDDIWVATCDPLLYKSIE